MPDRGRKYYPIFQALQRDGRPFVAIVVSDGRFDVVPPVSIPLEEFRTAAEAAIADAEYLAERFASASAPAPTDRSPSAGGPDGADRSES